jgi:hypothetical protein
MCRKFDSCQGCYNSIVTKIAIVALVGEKDYFVDEANQMILSGQTLNNNFTFVLFAEPESFHKIKRAPNVLVYEYKSPDDDYYSKYRFAKSLVFVKENEHILKEYDYIVKTDTDVFFTPSLNDHIFDEKIYFGYGHHKSSIDQMFYFANKYGFYDYKDIISPNSTIIAPTKDMINIMEQSDILCKKIFYELLEGDSYFDSAYKWGKELYAGTSTLIATEIVMASLYNKDSLVYTDKIDADCGSKDNFMSVYHIHQWHTDNIYSKFKAREGLYDNMDYATDESIASYGLNIFLKNKKEFMV